MTLLCHTDIITLIDGKSRVRVPSEMLLISKSTEFLGSGNIAQMLIY
jgi:hypothetical protein